MKTYYVQIKPIFSGIQRRYFETKQDAETWCHMAGYKHLIPEIKQDNNAVLWGTLDNPVPGEKP